MKPTDAPPASKELSSSDSSNPRPLTLLKGGPWPSFRDDLMDQILAEHPGLTREKLDEQMRSMGF